MITDIKIQDENYSLDWEKKLSWLSKINIFVGSNNSWKSRFLRSIFTNELKILTDFIDNNIKLFIKEYKELLSACNFKAEKLKKLNHIIWKIEKILRNFEWGKWWDIYNIIEYINTLIETINT